MKVGDLVRDIQLIELGLVVSQHTEWIFFVLCACTADIQAIHKDYLEVVSEGQ